MVDPRHIYLWTWDARPYPAFPADTGSWADGVNHATGHWLNGRLGGLASDELAAAIAADHGVFGLSAMARPPLLTGYRIDAPSSGRQALEPVLAATGLVLADGAEGLVARMARPRLAAEIAREALVADEGALLTRRRPDAGEAVGRLALGFLDRERGYLSASVTAALPEPETLAAEAGTLVLDLAGARRAAERLLIERAAHRETVELRLSEAELALEPGDTIAIAGEAGGPWEITEIRDGASRRIAARAVPPVLEVALSADRAAPVPAGTGFRSLPVLVAAHLPPDPANPAASRLLLAATAKPWPGDVVVTAAATGGVLARLKGAATLGELTTPLEKGPIAIWDRANRPVIRLYGGHIASADDGVVFAGGNWLALEKDSGDWELVGFAEAELIGPSTYRLSRLLRGLGGTDFALGLASPGRRLAVLDERAAILPVPADWLGAEVALRSFAGPADLDGTLSALTVGLGPVLPLAPGHLKARRTPSGDIGLSWVRRSRADTGSWASAEVPQDNAPEAYRVTIRDGGAAVRVIAASEPAAVYAVAEQEADFGALPTAFDFEVAQISPLYGAGHLARGAFHG
jgi:hypothetical protein